eukprot:gb/GECH01009227.1/.p1 GENE.gb/GECH01009227.1/~~gb/GECH01009227.1/.p1  ORF type:complete len:275 (+),score=32.16 gb/GECH01009227.1/:1-825(+)
MSKELKHQQSLLSIFNHSQQLLKLQKRSIKYNKPINRVNREKSSIVNCSNGNFYNGYHNSLYKKEDEIAQEVSKKIDCKLWNIRSKALSGEIKSFTLKKNGERLLCCKFIVANIRNQHPNPSYKIVLACRRKDITLEIIWHNLPLNCLNDLHKSYVKTGNIGYFMEVVGCSVNAFHIRKEQMILVQEWFGKWINQFKTSFTYSKVLLSVSMNSVSSFIIKLVYDERQGTLPEYCIVKESFSSKTGQKHIDQRKDIENIMKSIALPLALEKHFQK